MLFAASVGSMGTSPRVQQHALATQGAFILNGRVNDAADNGSGSTWNALDRARDRWRATNPGIRSVSRFTRNFKTETSSGSPSGKEIIWSFKSPAVAAAVALVAGAIHYLTGFAREAYPGSHIARR